MEIEYPDIELPDYPNTDDKETKFWIGRTAELSGLVIKLMTKLSSHLLLHKEATIASISILRRHSEIADSIMLLASKGKVRDAGVLLLNVYELTQDIQYLSLDIDRCKTWLHHQKESKKSWKVDEQIREIFPLPSDYETEKKLYRHYSMVKHGNMAGKYNAFDVFIKDDYLAFATLRHSLSIHTLQALSFLCRRALAAAVTILNCIGADEIAIAKEMSDCYGRYSKDMESLMTFYTLKILYPDDVAMQEEKARAFKLFAEYRRTCMH